MKGWDLCDSSATSSSKKGLFCMKGGKGLDGEIEVEELEDMKGLV